VSVLKVLTLRNLPPRVAAAISRRARERRTSLTKAAVSLLEEALGMASPEPVRYHDLDHLAGAWTRDEAAAFEAHLRDGRRIDPDVWQ
jgi:hypothetical protein